MKTGSGWRPRRSPTPGRSAALLGAAALAGLAAGCYSLGYVPAPALAGGRVAVPIFENRTLRRHLEHDLTRHVRRELLETTPLHLARSSDPGVPILRGVIEQVREGPLVVDARQQRLLASLVVTVSFGVFAGEDLVEGVDVDGDGRPDQPHVAIGYAEFAPPLGESRETAADEALRDVAEMIALRLQARGDDPLEPNDRPAEAAALAPGRQFALVHGDPDWFRLSVPARGALTVTLLGAAPGLSLRVAAVEAPGQELIGPAADAATRDRGEVQDGGRAVWVVGGREPGEVLLEVARAADAPGAMLPYQLLVEAPADDWREPDDVPAAAKPLAADRPLRLLQRDEDWHRVELPAGRALRARIEPLEPVAGEAAPGEVDLLVTDTEGVPLRAAVAAGPREASLPASDAARVVLLRVSGDGSGVPYRVSIAVE